MSWHAIGIGVVAYVLWIGLSSLDRDVSDAPTEALSERAAPLTALWIVGRALGSTLVIPAAEELAFAAAHQQWFGGFFAGVLYAYAQRRRGLLSEAILAHIVANALIAVQVLLAGHWSLW